MTATGIENDAHESGNGNGDVIEILSDATVHLCKGVDVFLFLLLPLVFCSLFRLVWENLEQKMRP